MNEKRPFARCYVIEPRDRSRISDEYLSLQELEVKLDSINEKQQLIVSCGLSPEVEALALKELQVKKDTIKDIMHKKINRL